MIYIASLGYSFHLSNDKNKKNSAKASAKSNISGTTSKSNNAIQNAAGLSKCDKHNCRKYDNEQELIEIVKGTFSIVEDVKKLYKNEFEEARIEYNSKQVREDRKIEDYFAHISNSTKNDLACEIIIELGDMEYWKTKDMDFKKKMTNVFKSQVVELERQVPNFKIASAIIHYDETSPHMHIVGVPIKYKNKNGMAKQVGKSDVFTKESLRKTQDKMRIFCIESFNKEYGLNMSLKTKQKGRNKDYHISEMDNYEKMKKRIEVHQSNLQHAKDESDKLKNDIKNIESIIDNLKTKGISKTQYVLSQEEKDTIRTFIKQTEKTNKKYDTIQDISVSFEEISNSLLMSKQQVQLLTENNKSLSSDVDNLTEILKDKNEEIYNLKEENNSLKFSFQHLKDMFYRLIHFLMDKILRSKDKEKYKVFAKELYEHGAIDDENMKSIRDISVDNKDKNYKDYSKEKDDFER